MPGRCGSPRKLAALPNRPAQVASLLSQPSSISTRSPIAGGEGRRLVQGQPVVRPSAGSRFRARYWRRRSSAAGRRHTHCPAPPSSTSTTSAATTAAIRVSRVRPAMSTRHLLSPSAARHSGEVCSTTGASSKAVGPRNSASKAVALDRNLAELAARDRQDARRPGASQSTMKIAHRRPVPAPGGEVGAADRIAGQRALDVERVRVEPVRDADRRRQHARRRAIDEPADRQIAVVAW